MVIKGEKAIGEYIGYSKASVQRNKDKLHIPYFRTGRIICAKSEDLSAWIDEQIEKNWNTKGGRR